jgi:parallel beta-helix repeat protein
MQDKGFADSLSRNRKVNLPISHQEIESDSHLNLRNTFFVENTQIPTKKTSILSISKKSEAISLFNYEIHDPIVIDGNVDFIAQARAENWLGDGSESNPIIINGLTISGSGAPGALISIYNTDLHFRITSSFLSGEEHGISLSSVLNGVITKNIITNNFNNGITIFGSSNNNKITNNTISNCRIGVASDFAYHNTFSFNLIKNMSSAGFIIQNGCFDNLLDSNVLSECGEFGILVGDLGNVYSNILRNNTIYATAGAGIDIISESCLNQVLKNTIHNNGGIGIHINTGSLNVVYDNNIYDNFVEGIRISDSDNNNISHNWIYSNHLGIELSNSSNNLIFNNTLYSNDNTGIMIGGSHNNISENHIVNNNGGIGLYSSAGNYLTNNTIHDNKNIGIMLDYSHNNTFFANIISNSGEAGFFILRSDSNVFTENIIWNNFYEGLNIASDSDNNVVSFNDFTDNYIPKMQAGDNGLGNIFVYNYWNNWITPDTDSDGIVDIPYPIESGTDATNQDPYPLVNLNLERSHLILSPIILHPNGGEVLNSTIYINWTSSVDSHKHEINYTLYYSSNNGQDWVLLESDLKTTSYQWETKTVSNGKQYLIKIVASCCSEGLNVTDFSNTVFIIENVNVSGFPNDVIQILVGIAILIGCVGTGYFLLNSRLRHPKSFFEFIQSDQIEFLRPIYHKVIVGLENIATAIMSETMVPPLLEEPTTPTSLAKWFPTDYRSELKSELKGRTVLTLIEIAFLYAEEANLTILAQNLDIPPSTLSDELRKLVKLNYLDFHVSPQVLHDGRFRHYIITSKGISFLKILKSALDLSIRRIKEKEQSSAI